MRPDEREELMHYGIYGMKWGIRRYQNPDGTLTEAGKRRYRTGGDGTFEDEKGEKRYGKDVRKQTKSDAKLEKRKQKAIASGSVDNILKMRSYMTSQELTDAVNRVRNMETLRANTPEKLQKAEDRAEFEAKMKTVGTLATGITNATNAYNGAAKIFNVLPFDTKLPIVGEKQNSGENKSNVRDSVRALIESGDFATIQKMAAKGQLSLKEVQEANQMIASRNALNNNIKVLNNTTDSTSKTNQTDSTTKTNQTDSTAGKSDSQSSSKKEQREIARQEKAASREAERETKKQERLAEREAKAERESTIRVARAAAERAASLMENADFDSERKDALALGQRAAAMINGLGDTVPASVRREANQAYGSLLAQYQNSEFNWHWE